MNANISNVIFLALLVGGSTQAADVQKEMQHNLAKTIDCSTATADIKTLGSEKARAEREIEYGASSITPDYAVAPMFTAGEEKSSAIEAGKYRLKLEEKIAEIKQQCNIQ